MSLDKEKLKKTLSWIYSYNHEWWTDDEGYECDEDSYEFWFWGVYPHPLEFLSDSQTLLISTEMGLTLQEWFLWRQSYVINERHPLVELFYKGL